MPNHHTTTTTPPATQTPAQAAMTHGLLLAAAIELAALTTKHSHQWPSTTRSSIDNLVRLLDAATRHHPNPQGDR